MLGLIYRLVLALVVGVFVWVVCILIGALLALLSFPPAVVAGDWVRTYAVLFGILAFLWYLFAGGPAPSWWPGRRQ